MLNSGVGLFTFFVYFVHPLLHIDMYYYMLNMVFELNISQQCEYYGIGYYKISVLTLKN